MVKLSKIFIIMIVSLLINSTAFSASSNKEKLMKGFDSFLKNTKSARTTLVEIMMNSCQKVCDSGCMMREIHNSLGYAKKDLSVKKILKDYNKYAKNKNDKPWAYLYKTCSKDILKKLYYDKSCYTCWWNEYQNTKNSFSFDRAIRYFLGIKDENLEYN